MAKVHLRKITRDNLKEWGASQCKQEYFSSASRKARVYSSEQDVCEESARTRVRTTDLQKWDAAKECLALQVDDWQKCLVTEPFNHWQKPMLIPIFTHRDQIRIEDNRETLQLLC